MEREREEFERRMREHIKGRGWSPAQIAANGGITAPQTVERWLKGGNTSLLENIGDSLDELESGMCQPDSFPERL